MSKYVQEVRRRGRNLLIVEGDHEKNKLFRLLFGCFPEIRINMEDVWIYGTNIYMLYKKIIKEYGDKWTEDDVDLPFLLSKEQAVSVVCRKEDFVNIILVFDYERHDPDFSEKKIEEMQNYFVDAADTGRLYLNYPMIESYQHLRKMPDEDYAERKILVSLQPGSKYKELVRKETGIARLIEFPQKVRELLNEHFGVTNVQVCENCVENILCISDEKGLKDQIREILQAALRDKELETAIHQFSALVTNLGYIHNGRTYWEYMRKVFQQIIFHNVCKAQKIQYGKYQIDSDQYRECFDKISLSDIVKIQNSVSQNDRTGFIWVLNTCVFFIAEYNFSLLV